MKQWLGAATLLLLVIASYWFLRGLENSLVIKPILEQSQEIMSATEVKSNNYAPDASLKYQLYSQVVREFSQQGGTKFEKPHFQFMSYGKGKATVEWQGQSRQAHLSADKNVLKLDGDVKIIQLPNSDNPAVITARYLDYFADKKKLLTHAPVLIENHDGSQKALALNLDLQSQKANFLGEVKAHFSSRQN